MIIDFKKIESYNFSNIFTNLINYETAIRCRKLAEEYFSLDKGVKKYKTIYNSIFTE